MPQKNPITKHRGSADEPSPSEFTVVENKGFKPRSGEFSHRAVPITPKQAKTRAFLDRKGVSY